MIWSACISVATRCAIKIIVEPPAASRSLPRMASSVFASTAESASSNTMIGECYSSVRAMAVRCFCPPESVTPRSPTTVSYPA